MKLPLAMAILLCGLTGCATPHNWDVAYVQDPSHHCQVDRVVQAYPEWNSEWGALEREPGSSVVYKCDNHTYIVFQDGEQRP